MTLVVIADLAWTGQILVLRHDGALAAAQLDDPEDVRAAVKTAALRSILAER